MHLVNSRATRALPVLVLTAGLALGLTACSSDSSGSASRSVTQDAPMSRESGAGAAAQDAAKAGAGAVAATEQKVVRRADTSLLVKDVNTAADQVRAIATTAGGSVTNESLSTGGRASADLSGSITISVPADKLDDAMKRLAELGEVVSRTTTSDDVTAQYVDTESRLATLRASVDRVRALMTQATKIEDIVALESELSRRQADLESLEAQLRNLKDEVAQSPISVQLSADRTELADSGGGFLAGLKAGWEAFSSSVVVLLTILGALLPFALAGALVIAPVVWFLRRRASNRRAAYAASSQAQPVTPMPAQPAPAPTGAGPTGAGATGAGATGAGATGAGATGAGPTKQDTKQATKQDPGPTG